MTKIEALKSDLATALLRLNEALILPETDINRDASIQRFEFTFELSWKLMAEIVKENSKIEFSGIRNTIRSAASINLVEDASIWFSFLESRNLTSHTYNQKVATEIYNNIKNFPPLVSNLLDQIPKFI